MKKRHHICILDKDAFYAGLLARKCEQRGWKTSVVETFDQALRCFAKGADALVVDVEGGETEALACIKELRRHAASARPVMVVTRHHDPKTIARFLKAGVSGYLLKGHFLPQETIEKLQRLLDHVSE